MPPVASRRQDTVSEKMISASHSRSISRVGPAEARLTQAEENAQRVSGQIDELMAVSNAASGGAKAAQETADAAIAGVNATNAAHHGNGRLCRSVNGDC